MTTVQSSLEGLGKLMRKTALYKSRLGYKLVGSLRELGSSPERVGVYGWRTSCRYIIDIVALKHTNRVVMITLVKLDQ